MGRTSQSRARPGQALARRLRRSTPVPHVLRKAHLSSRPGGTWLVWTAAPSSSPALASAQHSHGGGGSQPRAARGSPRRSRQPQHVEKWPAGGQNPAPHAHLCPHLGSPWSVLGGQRPPACTRTGLPADAAVATPPAPGCSPCKDVHLLL